MTSRGRGAAHLTSLIMALRARIERYIISLWYDNGGRQETFRLPTTILVGQGILCVFLSSIKLQPMRNPQAPQKNDHGVIYGLHSLRQNGVARGRTP